MMPLFPSAAVKAYFINLESARDRRASMEAALAETGLEFQRVEAIDGRNIELPHPDYDAGKYHKFHGRTTKPGEIGCFLSHIKALREFLADGAELGLICEDDLQFQPDFGEALRAAIGCSSEWNLLRLSGLSQGKAIRVREVLPGRFLCVNLGRLKGAGAYLVDRQAAQAMVEGCLPMWLPWDHAIDREWNFGLRAGSIIPFPVSQTDHRFKSSIQGGKAQKLKRLRRWSTTYPYQAVNEVSRWVTRGIRILRLVLQRRPRG